MVRALSRWRSTCAHGGRVVAQGVRLRPLRHRSPAAIDLRGEPLQQVGKSQGAGAVEDGTGLDNCVVCVALSPKSDVQHAFVATHGELRETATGGDDQQVGRHFEVPSTASRKYAAASARRRATESPVRPPTSAIVMTLAVVRIALNQVSAPRIGWPSAPAEVGTASAAEVAAGANPAPAQLPLGRPSRSLPSRSTTSSSYPVALSCARSSVQPVTLARSNSAVVRTMLPRHT